MAKQLLFLSILILIPLIISATVPIFCGPLIWINEQIGGTVTNIVTSVYDVEFYIRTAQDKKLKKIDESNLQKSKFNPLNKTVVIIHGFVNDPDSEWINKMVTGLLNWDKNMNVIAVDWSPVWQAALVNYGDTAVKTRDVAKRIKEFLKDLADEFHAPLANWPYIHFIGHSLGAHVAGQTAALLKKKNLVHVHRITGLDPARPFFDTEEGSSLRLDKDNARFVDVIHTNSHPTEETLGLYAPIGHIDFYPNGGNKQPCCTRQSRSFTELGKCFSKLIAGIDVTKLFTNWISSKLASNDIVCDHGTAQNYFIQSLDTTKTFKAIKTNFSTKSKQINNNPGACTDRNCIDFGIKANLYAQPTYYGVYYIRITDCN